MKGVSQEGGIAAGHALLQVKTAEGGDICFAAYRPSRHQIGGLDTDAMQAFVGRRGTEISVLYLGGGTTLKVDNGHHEE